MVSWVGHIGAITLFTEDLEASRTFYENVFASEVIFEDPHSCVFKFGDTMINLLITSEAHGLIEPTRVAKPADGARVQFTIDVEDVDAAANQIVANGASLLNGPQNRPWGIRTAAFADPSGHIWEIAGPQIPD